MKIIKKYRGTRNKGCVIKRDSSGLFHLYRYNEYIFKSDDLSECRQLVRDIEKGI